MMDIDSDRRMTESERHQKIMEFIEQNPKRTKAQVMRHMQTNGSSEPTAFKDLTNLIKNGRITVLKDKPNSQTHFLILNNNNKFNILEGKMDETFEILSAYASYYRNAFMRNEDFNDFAILNQVVVSSIITGIANQIANDIESKDKREELYPHLIKLLVISDRVNELLAPVLFLRVEALLEDMKATSKNNKSFKNLKTLHQRLRNMFEQSSHTS